MEKSSNLKVAIFGASSQVGSSVAFYLRHFTNHQPFCFIRSKYSAVFFEMADITTITADINDTASLKEHLKNMDIVLDFTFPAGQVFQIPKFIAQNFESIISAMPARAAFVHMSSIMAYGMPSDEKQLRSYTFPRASYGYTKRQAEKNANKAGAKYGIRIFNFRLGQVHGFLQSVSSSFNEKLSSGEPAYLDGNPEDLTNTIFISTLAEAIISCGSSKVPPGTYTLVSSPQWTLKELYEYYLNFFSLNTSLVYYPKAAETQSSLVAKTFGYLKKYRPIIETYLFLNMPKTSITIKGKYRVSEIANQIRPADHTYIDFNLLGMPTVPVIDGLNCSVKQVTEAEKAMQNLYFSMLNSHIIESSQVL